MTDTPLDRAVDAALDARRDPLTDDAVLEALVDEPERFAEIARLSDDARGLGGERRTRVAIRRRRRARRPVAVWGAVAVAALATIVATLALGPDGEPRDSSANGSGDTERMGPESTSSERNGSVHVAAERDTAAPLDHDTAVASRHATRSTIDDLRVTVRSGRWRPGATDSRSATVLMRTADGPTTILRTAGAVAPDGSSTTISFEERVR